MTVWKLFARPRGGARAGGGAGARLCLFTFLVSSGARARSFALDSAMGSNVGVSSGPSASGRALAGSADGRVLDVAEGLEARVGEEGPEPRTRANAPEDTAHPIKS